MNRGNFQHGHHRRDWKSPTYSSWQAMKTRCDNPSSTRFPEYGACGISYDPRWADFTIFLSDMGERPDGTTLDRLDGTKGYSKENCRWATPIEQTRNRKRTRCYFYAGEFLTAAEFAEKYGLSYACAKNRLDRGQSLTTENRYLTDSERASVRKMLEAGMSRREIADKFGITSTAVRYIELH